MSSRHFAVDRALACVDGFYLPKIFERADSVFEHSYPSDIRILYGEDREKSIEDPEAEPPVISRRPNLPLVIFKGSDIPACSLWPKNTVHVIRRFVSEGCTLVNGRASCG